MAKTAGKKREAYSWANVQSGHKHKPQTKIQVPEQKQTQAQIELLHGNGKAQCHIWENSGEKFSEQTHEQNGHPNPQAVVVRLRGCRLALLPRDKTNPDSLRKEAAQFDKLITYREWRGKFETMKSMRGHFVVQYDKADVDEAGTPKSVIGITEEILPWDDDAEKGDEKDADGPKGEKKTQEEDDDDTASGKSTIYVNTSKPVQGKRSRTSLLCSDDPRAKKPCQGLDPDDSDSSLDSDSDGDDDTDTDADEFDDSPPDWSEYETGNEFMENQPGSNDEPEEILDTRVDFAKVDIIPEKVYEELYESENSVPKPRDYLIRGVPLPEMTMR